MTDSNERPVLAVRVLRDPQPPGPALCLRLDGRIPGQTVLDVWHQSLGLLPNAGLTETAHGQPHVFTLSDCHLVSLKFIHSSSREINRYSLGELLRDYEVHEDSATASLQLHTSASLTKYFSLVVITG